jgi:ABC-type uncharacterized transport system substrate-binding protein
LLRLGRLSRAQQAAMPVIGYMSGRSPDAEESMRTPILAALEEAGFVTGRNVAIEYRFAEGREECLPLESDLVRRLPTLLIATNRSSTLAVKAATTTIPIVFGVGEDPVQLGLVASLNRPGGNAHQ